MPRMSRLCTAKKAYESSIWARFVFKRGYPCDQNYGHRLCGTASQTVMHMQCTLEYSAEHRCNSTVSGRPSPTERLHACCVTGAMLYQTAYAVSRKKDNHNFSSMLSARACRR